MNDVMNMGHTVYNQNYCAFGAACHVYKQWLPGTSGKIKVCIDSAWGSGKYTDRTYIVDEGNLYKWDGEGFSIVGSIAKWKAALQKRRRLAQRRLQDPVTAAAAVGVVTELAKNTSITVDANKMVDQLKGVLSSDAKNGAVVLNMDKAKAGHTLYMMNDVMNMGHTVYNQNY